MQPDSEKNHELADELDPVLTQLFAQRYTDLADEAFVSRVMTATSKARRAELAGRLVLGVVVMLAMIPLQDAALELAALLMVQLVNLESSIATALLAPVNSVGALLALLLFLLRAAHRRLFARG